MRVLTVNDLPLGPGSGAEVHAARLTEALRRSGHEVAVFAGAARHSGAGRILDVWDPRARRSLRALADSFMPEVVHYHNITRELSASVLGAIAGAARVMTVHDVQLLGPTENIGGTLRPLRSVKAMLDRMVIRRRVHALIALTRPLADQLRAAGFADVHVVPNFAEPGPEPDRPPSASSAIVYAGRLTRSKGCAVLVEAFLRIAARFPDAELILAGDGPERGTVEVMARNEPAGRIRVLGMVPEAQARELMTRARLVAVPSIEPEVSPNVVVEAAFAGRPAVVSDFPGTREMVEAGDCGLIVPPGDPGALAGALEQILGDPSRADGMGRSGRLAAMATRTPEAAAAQTVRVYDRALSLAGSRARGREPRAREVR